MTSWFLAPAWPRVLPFALFLLLLAARGLPVWDGLSIDTRWLYALQAGLALAALIAYRRQYGELSAARRPEASSWLLAVVAGLAVFGLWIGLDWEFATIGESQAVFVPLDQNGELLWSLVIVRIAGAALVVPVIEELFWRSLLMRWLDHRDFLALDPARVSARALLLSAFVFGIEHPQWLAGLIAGLVYGELYRRSGNLWVPIAAHALTNLLLGIWVVATGAWHYW